MKDLSWSSSHKTQQPSSRGGVSPSCLGILLLTTLLLLSPVTQARVYIQIDQPSDKKFPVAVVNLVHLGGGSSSEWEKGVAKKIAKDLAMTGLFDVVPNSQYPNERDARLVQPGRINFKPWSLIGAQAVINGGYSVEGNVTRVEMHLYDPLLGQHLLGRDYQAGRNEIGTVAHHFANEVMRELTGEEGVFGTKLTFTTVTGKRKKEIAVTDMDGDNATIVTHHNSISLSPSWASGGQIVYSSYTKAGNPEIMITGLKGQARALTRNGSINLSPRVAPGGGGVAFASAVGGDTELFLMGLGGGMIRRLTNSYGIDINPSWSPDGGSFVFASERAGKLHIFKSTGERLTFVGYHNDRPAWSPKGDKILFQGRDQGTWDIFVMDADGSNIQRLTSGEGSNESPTWAPNGRFIAFSSTRQGKAQIFVTREDGANPTQLPFKGSALQPNWGPKTN